MAGSDSVPFHFIYSILILVMSLLCTAIGEDRKVHIVYMGSLPKGNYSPSSHHTRILKEVVGDSAGTNYLTRSYKRSFNGFAAKLNAKEQQRLAGMEGVVSVFPSRMLQLQTTRSWDFMGFTDDVIRNPTVESNVIIGVIDTGIWPESESFSDEGFGPPPKKWKGACKGGTNFTCNNKIVGARYYPSKSKDMSTRDKSGHGSHTASTAAGNKVKDANFYGLAQGNARGGVPSARIAAYAVCRPDSGCPEENVLAAFDDAIADGVDMITLSVGRSDPIELVRDAIAIGAFHAMEKGILTSHSAGNNGFVWGTIVSVAPWMLSVAASTTDRRIIDKVVLGNGRTLIGNSVNSFRPTGNIPLIQDDDLCSLLGAKFSGKGKILLCDQLDGGEAAVRAGVAGSIMPNDSLNINISKVDPLPASVLNEHDFDVVKSYMNSTKEPQANILRSEVIKDFDAPVVASFSSLGPNGIVPEILKPDVTAPGVSILAAYSPIVSPSTSSEDKRSVKYNIISGTSMSCPHATGAAAYIKTMHPNWSPSAIKSALMTTAWPMNATKNRYSEFSYGSGHIDPVKAANPGLVYETSKEDYIKMLCSMGYNMERLRLISGDNSPCPANFDKKASPKDLNYPSMTVNVRANKSFEIEFHRTVKNVGLSNSTYKATIFPNSLKSVKVVPNVLSFKALNESKSFVVSVVGVLPAADSMASTQLVWSDGTYNVRSPIVVYNGSLSI